MEKSELISQGAEARIYRGYYLGQDVCAKERFVKKYRHPHLDEVLTKERIKAEARAVVRCKMAGIRTPSIYLVDFERRTIFMEYFTKSRTLKEYIDKNALDEISEICRELGKIIGRMHESDIVHGDLTTSNVLVTIEKEQIVLVLIDFGFAGTDASCEDKAVDLYVLERALLSAHLTAHVIFDKIIEGYKETFPKGYKEVLSKLEEVRARGRKRTMVG